MKKLLSLFLSSILILSTTACGKQTTPEEIPLPETNEFTMNFPTDENNVLIYTENDDYDTLEMAGPYYLGAQPSNQPGLIAFNKAKKERIDAAIKSTHAVFENSKKLKESFEGYKRSYVDFLNDLYSADKSLETAVKEAAAMLIEYQLKEEALVAQYEGTEIPSDPAAAAFTQYSQTSTAVNLSQTLTEDISTFFSASAQLSLAYEESENEALKSAVQSFDAQMASISQLFAELKALQDKVLELDAILKQINTADHYIGLASLEFLQQQFPNIQAQINSLQPREEMTSADIDFISEYATFFQNLSNDLNTAYKNSDPKDLIDPQILETAFSDSSILFPQANAAAQGYFSSAMSSLKSGLVRTIKYGAEKVDSGLDYTGVKNIFRKGTKAAGFGLESLQAATKSGFDIMLGKMNGLSNKDIGDNIMSNFEKMHKNIKEGKEGAEIFKTAEDYLDSLEKAGGKLASKPFEKVIGPGYTSWLAGKIGQMTTNMFTGFGKGIYKIANQNSSKGTIAEGMLDVGFSFIGGSKALMKGSQALKGGKESLKLLGQKGFNFFEKALNTYRQNGIKSSLDSIWKQAKISGTDFNKLIQLSTRDRARDGIKKTLQKTSQGINDKFQDLLKTGYKTILTNSTTGAKKAVEEFVKDEFKFGLVGVMNAMKSVIGGSMKEYMDNLIGSAIDDMIKAIVKDAIDGKEISEEEGCDSDEEDCEEESSENGDDDEETENENEIDEENEGTFPALSSLAGPWQNGNMTITDFSLADDIVSGFAEGANEAGCEAKEQLEEAKGKPKPMALTVNPTSDSGGTLTLRIEDEDSKEIPFTYSNGVIQASYSEQGAVATINMKAAKDGNGYTTEGSFNIDAPGYNISIKSTVSASK